MRDKLGPGTNLGYCANVHGVTDRDGIHRYLETHTLAIKDLVAPDTPMAVGLWFPESVLDDGGAWTIELFEWMSSNGLYTQSFNGFPQRDFHSPVVKHGVYEPMLGTDLRTRYLLDLYGAFMREKLVACRDPQRYEANWGPDAWMSISTLPIGWPGSADEDATQNAGNSLRHYARLCEKVNGTSSRTPRITIDLEPEPGCILDTADDVITFFDEHLPDESHRKHIGVCHDVCHAAVMFEDQRTVLRRYAEAGIRVNKVQISSALDVDVRAIGVDTAIEHLRPFAEPRYLHQTGFKTGDDRESGFELIEDLPEALERLEQGPSAGPIPDRLRVHFHVPVYLDSIGPLGTTNDQIADAVAAAREYHDTRHFEVETYAWGVLPDELKRDTLAEGIADELKWVLKTCGV